MKQLDYRIDYYLPQIHGTHRKPDRIYREYLYTGQGKPLSEATREELVQEVEERETEGMNSYKETGAEMQFSQHGKLMVQQELLKRNTNQ